MAKTLRRPLHPATAAQLIAAAQPHHHAELERRLAECGCPKVNLLIEPDNHTVTSFYTQHGYTEDQLIFMEKPLPPGTSPGQPPHTGAS